MDLDNADGWHPGQIVGADLCREMGLPAKRLKR